MPDTGGHQRELSGIHHRQATDRERGIPPNFPDAMFLAPSRIEPQLRIVSDWAQIGRGSEAGCRVKCRVKHKEIAGNWCAALTRRGRLLPDNKPKRQAHWQQWTMRFARTRLSTSRLPSCKAAAIVGRRLTGV